MRGCHPAPKSLPCGREEACAFSHEIPPTSPHSTLSRRSDLNPSVIGKPRYQSQEKATPPRLKPPSAGQPKNTQQRTREGEPSKQKCALSEKKYRTQPTQPSRMCVFREKTANNRTVVCRHIKISHQTHPSGVRLKRKSTSRTSQRMGCAEQNKSRGSS